MSINGIQKTYSCVYNITLCSKCNTDNSIFCLRYHLILTQSVKEMYKHEFSNEIKVNIYFVSHLQFVSIAYEFAHSEFQQNEQPCSPQPISTVYYSRGLTRVASLHLSE